MIKNLNKWLKENNMEEIHINMGMFDFGINVLIGSNKNLEEYVRYKIEDETFYMQNPEKAYGWHIHYEDYCPIIWIPKKPKTPKEHATLCHESIHAVFSMYNWAHMQPLSSNDEVMCHAVGYIVKTVLES